MPTHIPIHPADPFTPIARPHSTVGLASWLALSAVLSAAPLGGCVAGDGGESAKSPSRTAGGALSVARAELLDATVVGADTLSDSAYVTGVYPEADGEAVAFTFADPRRRVSAGLALAQRKAPAPALLWPDSVATVWWSAPHAVSFTTRSGTGVHVVVDVHAERAAVTDDSAARAPAAGAKARPSDPARARATAYIDSVHVQPAGRPQGSALRYTVTDTRTSPDGRLTAFYAVATDSAGRQTNPAWYAMNADGGGVTPIDEVVGPLGEMPETAAGWTADGRFVYAKRQTLWEATVRPAAVRRDTIRRDTARQAPRGS